MWGLASRLAVSDEVTVLTTPVPGKPSRYEKDGVTVMTVAGAPPGRYSPSWWMKTARWDTSPYDVVVSVSAGATTMRVGAHGAVLVFQAHGTAGKELMSALRTRNGRWPLRASRLMWWTMVDNITYRRSAAVVSIGPAVTRSLRSSFYPKAWHRTVLREIPNGVPGGDRTRVQRRLDAGQVVAVTVSRLVRQKGVDRAVAALPYTDARLVVVGDGEERGPLQQQADTLGVGERLDLLGHKDDEGVRAALGAADVLVFTPRNIELEGLPMNVQEALAARVPVITLDGPLWPGDLRAELYLVDSTDPKSLGDAIDRARSLDRPSLPERYSAQGSADAYRSLFRQLVSRQHNPRTLQG